MMAVDCLDLFRFDVTESAVMRFWPGDPANQILEDNADYTVESAKKRKAARDFPDIGRYREHLLLRALSGIPRWKSPHVLDVGDTEKLDVSRVIGALNFLRSESVKNNNNNRIPKHICRFPHWSRG